VRAARLANLPTAGGDALGLANASPGATAVIDTNAWLDLFVFRDARAQGLVQALRQRRVLALRSSRTDAELHAVLQRPIFAARLKPADRDALLREWVETARNMEGTAIRTAPWICRDPDDQKFLDLAFSAGAAWLFTKDRALLDLARKARLGGVRILTPEVFAATPLGLQV
jgi:putative PIN family toxin of toxin-antitoxin system